MLGGRGRWEPIRRMLVGAGCSAGRMPGGLGCADLKGATQTQGVAQVQGAAHAAAPGGCWVGGG